MWGLECVVGKKVVPSTQCNWEGQEGNLGQNEEHLMIKKMQNGMGHGWGEGPEEEELLCHIMTMCVINGEGMYQKVNAIHGKLLNH